MRPWFSVGALAVAAPRANVAGAVRLTCTPEGLEIELLRVTGFTQGFAPGGLADPVGFRVPYTAVRGLVRDGRMLYLALDPAVVSPYTRFALARFDDDPDRLLARTQATRAPAHWASVLLPVPVGALLAMVVPGTLAGGVFGRAAVGVLTTLAIGALLRWLSAWQPWASPRSDQLRDRFEAELAEQLALTPPSQAPVYAVRLPVRASRSAVSVVERSAVPAKPMPLASSMPAPLLKPLFVAMVTAVGVVGVGALLHRYAAEKTPAPTFVRLQAGLAAAARTIQLDVRPLPEAPRCLCQRADSPLWKDGIPVLGVITFDSDEGPLGAPEAQLDRAGFPQFAFGLAIINNSARALRDLRVTLTFARRDHAGHRVGAVDRGLFWEGVLSPGHAAKWNVSAPGSELRRDIGVTGTLDQTRLAPAPADAFFALTSSRVRAVRLHGATMLAYLRDPRAAVVARRFTLDNARDGAVVARIQRAAADVIPCDLRRSGESLQACIFNASSRVKQALTLREVTPAHDTSGLRSIPIAETIPVHEGIRVRLDLPADGADEWAVVDPTATE